MTRQRLSTKERRREIMEAALRILHTQGVAGLTLRQLAADIRLSEAAIYRHFSNKQEIVEHVAAHVFRGPPAIDLRPDAAAQEQLRQIIFAQLRFLDANPYITAVVFQEEIFREFPGVERMFVEHRRAMMERMAAVVREGQRRGTVRTTASPEVIAVIFLGTIRELVSEWRTAGFRHSLLDRAKPVVDELMRLLDVCPPSGGGGAR